MSEGRPSMGLCGIPAKVRALSSCDLDSHVSFIRKSLAAGIPCHEIGASLGVTASVIDYYARKMRMVWNRRGHSTTVKGYPGTDGIPSSNYRPVQR